MLQNTIEARLREMGVELPDVPRPMAEYVPAKCVGDLVYVSGQGPIRNGKALYVGQVGAELSLEDAYQAAQICCLNCLAAVKAVVGSLDMIEEIVHVRGFVNSSPDFYEQPKVVDGASELLVKLFGNQGRHARAALGTSNLPGNIPIELEMIVRVIQN